MKQCYLILLVGYILVFCNSAWGYCPQDTLDRGQCDTMYIEPWPPDIADSVCSRPGPYFVKVPIYITDDIYASYNDSIRAFVIPLCYTHSNPAKYCSVTTYMNRILWTGTNPARSIFRHLPSNDDIQVHNWMMDLYDIGEGGEWDFIVLDLDGTTHFWLAMIPGGTDPLFPAGSRILLATMTMKLEDTMHICIDTCFWPPSSRLAFAEYPEEGTLAITKIPRSGTGTNSFQICFNLAETGPIKVTSPNGGEEWCVQSTHDITWDCFETNNVEIEYSTNGGTTWMTKIEYSTNGGSSWMTITESVPCANERYPWTIPNNTGSNCLISICDVPQTYCDRNDGFFSIISCHPGDVNGDGVVDIGDVIYLISYLYKSGPKPDPLANGDVNADCLVDVGDVVYLINYLFKNGVPLQVGCA